MRGFAGRPGAFAALLALPLIAVGCSDPITGPAPAPTDDRVAPDALSASAQASLQATPPGHIRIGVVPSATEILIGAEGDFTVINKATGAPIFEGSAGEATVELVTAGTIDTRFWLQARCVGEAARDAWLAEMAALGHETRTELAPDGSCWRLQLGTMEQGFSERVAFQEEAIAEGWADTDAFWTPVTIVTEEPQVRVTQAGVGHTLDAPAVLESDDGIVTIAGSPYRGIAEVWTNASGTLAGINELPLEEYLYGVVPPELPPEPFGLPEAQKAQAVTARTFARANLGRRGADGYDLLPTTADQVYGGIAVEHPVSTEAVDATEGVVAVHAGALISALYHSTSGGWTANSEDVFITELDYLRGVPDAERGRALERVPTVEVFMRHANPTNLRAHARGDFESDWSRLHRWRVEWTTDEMAEVLATSLDPAITEVTAVRVEDRADQGRVLRIEFDTDAGVFDAEKDGIRGTLRYIDADGVHAPLRSTLFFIESVHDRRTKEVTGWVAHGGGWGHGVGMSQTGAVGMAERGRSYEEILRHYYRGVELERRD
jgi:stage II sporulation protein D